jgi:hypothetical protein
MTELKAEEERLVAAQELANNKKKTTGRSYRKLMLANEAVEQPEPASLVVVAVAARESDEAGPGAETALVAFGGSVVASSPKTKSFNPFNKHSTNMHK